ncbi:MAG: hypothetical protein R3F47_02210 [Gammaproteobacteria bacterium]
MTKRTTEAKLDQLGNLNVSSSDPAALAALKKAWSTPCMPWITTELLLRTQVLAGDGDAYVIGAMPSPGCIPGAEAGL